MTNKDKWLDDYLKNRKRVIVGIAGRKKSGKDTAALLLVEKGFTVIRFADPLKNMLRCFYEYSGYSAEQIYELLEGDQKELPNFNLGGRTNRYGMQTLGTEWGRALIWDDIWVQALKQHVLSVERDEPDVAHSFVIPDIRFSNEVDIVHNLGGVVGRVFNPRVKIDPLVRHDSESGISFLKNMDFELLNDRTIPALHDKFRAELRRCWQIKDAKIDA